MKIIRRLCCALPVLVANLEANAQNASVQGIVIGLTADAIRSEADSLARQTGPGLSALIGMGVTRNAAILLGAGVAYGSDALLVHAALSARLYTPVMASRVVFYGEAGFMAHGREVSTDSLATGTGLSVGAGGEYFMRPHRSITVSAHRWSGRFDELAYQTTMLNLPARQWRVSVGVHCVLHADLLITKYRTSATKRPHRRRSFGSRVR